MYPAVQPVHRSTSSSKGWDLRSAIRGSGSRFAELIPTPADDEPQQIVLMDSALTVAGTGSTFDISRANDWRKMLASRVPRFVVCLNEIGDAKTQRPDLRDAPKHLANIREILNPPIADLAKVLGVSRQAVYKWINGDATPEPDKFLRIQVLSHAADTFRDAGVTRVSAMLRMKAFADRSLMDLAATDELLPEHIQLLITEAKKMDAAYDRSGLARTKAKPSDDWRAEVSIPGAPE